MKKNKAIVLSLYVCVCLCVFSGCTGSYTPKVSKETWDNNNAVYVDIAPDFIKDVFNNWEDAFEDIGLRAVFITNKEFEGAYNIEYTPTLTLLLVLDKDGAENQAKSVELLRNDRRVKSARAVNDVPFEPINTLAFAETQMYANVGDTLSMAISGYSLEYSPWFSHDSIFPIILKDYDKNKTYSPNDFPLSGANRIETMELSYATYLMMHLEKPSYFNSIKAVHAVAQDPGVLAVCLNYVYYISLVYSDVWHISDTSIAEIKNLDHGGYDSSGNHTGYYVGSNDTEKVDIAEVFCKKPGTFTLTFTKSLGRKMGGETMCTITVK